MGTVAVQFAKFGKAERGIEIAQENISESDQVSALANIAQVCTLQSKDELARQAIKAIVDDAQKMFALIGISDAKNELGEREKAVALLNEAATLCETVPQLPSRVAAYNELSKRLNYYGETVKARELFHESLETIANIRAENTRAVTLVQLADIYEQENFTLTDAEKAILQTMIR